MNAHIRLALLIAVTCLFPLPVRGASLRDMAHQLSDVSRQLSEEAYDGFARRDRGNRADVEALYVTLQFRASAELFERMVEDKRPQSELRDSVEILTADLSRMDRYAFGRATRSQLLRIVQNMRSELGGRSSGNYNPGYDQGQGYGKMQWSGRVDQEVVVMVRANRAVTRTVNGDRVRDENSQFDSPLPEQEVRVSLRRTDGRGSVEIVEQPSRRNNYSALVRIRDPKGGSDEYGFELTW